ncbi:MAG: DUF2721 domain-containing protein [Gemmataceae bacterium]
MLVDELVPTLQTAVGPAILISAVGLLLLSMTNRFGRIIDRSRQLAAARSAGGDESRIAAQLAILMRRARLVRLAIVLATTGALCAALLVITLFLAAVCRWGVATLVAIQFVACLTSVIASLVAFLGDINLSLVALKLELSVPRTGRS